MDEAQLTLDFERGIAESERAAFSRWSPAQILEVRAAIREVARLVGTFTTDHVWALLGPSFPFSKGIASQLLAVQREGLIRNTGTTTLSRRSGDHGHAQRLTVWEKV